MNETWLYGYTPPTAPGVKLTVDPMDMIYFDPSHKDDTVSVVTNVYDDGTKDITARGVEYREYFPKVGMKKKNSANGFKSLTQLRKKEQVPLQLF